MKKLYLTSPAFGGEIIVLYDLDNKLLVFDLQAATLNAEQVSYFKKKLPVVYEEATFYKSFESPSLVVIPETYEVTFEEWFVKYGIARQKKRALILWNKLSKSDQAKAMFAINPYDRYLMLNNWRTKAEPDTFLKNRMFDNDYSK